MDNKRRFSRVTAIFDVTLTRADGIFLAGTLRDIAVQGAFIICEPAMELGTPVAVTILLHGGIDDIPVRAQAEVVRREEGGAGRPLHRSGSRKRGASAQHHHLQRGGARYRLGRNAGRPPVA